MFTGLIVFFLSQEIHEMFFLQEFADTTIR